MKWINRLERKFGKYAIRNLPLIMILLEAVGYTLSVVAPNVLYYICFSPADICRGQVWRLITWVLMPPSRLDIFTVIMLFFYFWIARTLASTWGDFYFNIYILGGIIITDIGMMIAYPVFMSVGSMTALMNISYMSAYVNLYYIQTTILLAFAFTYPNAQVYLYFIIPIKMSWLGIFEGVMLVYNFIRVGMATPRLVILLAVLNFVIYFLLTKDLRRFHPKEFARRANYRKTTGQGGGFFSGFGSHGSNKNGGSGASGSGQNGRSPWGSGQNRSPWGSGQKGSSPWRSGQNNNGNGSRGYGQNSGAQNTGNPGSGNSGSVFGRGNQTGFTKIYPNGARHRCTICGRTELDDERLEFRYCSKCEGSHEYCQDHLFTHQHIKNGVPGGT